MEPKQLIHEAFSKIHHDISWFMQALREVLTDLGEHEAAQCLDGMQPAEQATPPAAAPARPDAPHISESKRRAHEVHALSIGFQLLNLVEENAAAQARRHRESALGADREPGLWAQNIRQLREAGYSAEEIASALREVHVEPVLTAHPTEAKRPTVLQIHRAIYLLIVQLENQMWTPAERAELQQEVRAQLERLWRTGEIFLAKPEVTSELENVLHYLREVFPGVLAKMDQRLRQAWTAQGFPLEMLDDPDNLPRLSFGNWVGGDRDGHPLVTPEVTRTTLQRLRSEGLALLQSELRNLASQLSLADFHTQAPQELRDAIARTAQRMGEVGRQAVARNPHEPWRQFVNLCVARLPIGDAVPSWAYSHRGELGDDLRFLRRTLLRVGATRLARAMVLPVERQVQVFGFQLAALDIRQNSAYHDKAVSQLLMAAGMPETDFEHWDAARRLAFLDAELRTPRPFAPRRVELGTEARSVLECYKVLADHVERFGTEGTGSLIVSMTRDVTDLLVVYLLAREVGLARHEAGGLVCPVPVVPLFETLSDLDRAPAIIRQFVEHPVTRRSLALQARQRPLVQAMVGYSDSNKDGGILAAQWAVHRAQQTMAETAESLGVEMRYFHGRGGTTSRGAGPTHRFLDALPHGSLRGSFRLTEQGETISQKYANAITATYNLELLMAGVAATTLKHRRRQTEEQPLGDVLDRLADHSSEAYRTLIDQPRFLEYWSEATPIDIIERAAIGSRPARRTGRRSFADLRAIPWVFSWNQSRHYLTGWYGLGTALDIMQRDEPEAFNLLAEKGTRMPFLRFFLYNTETALASVDIEVVRNYASLVKDAELREHFLGLVVKEWELTGQMIDRLFRTPRNQRRPRMLSTIALREHGLKLLHQHQVTLLKQWRDAHATGNFAEADNMLPVLLLTVNALASGLRTTG